VTEITPCCFGKKLIRTTLGEEENQKMKILKCRYFSLSSSNDIKLFNPYVGSPFLLHNSQQKVSNHYQVTDLGQPLKKILNQWLLLNFPIMGKKFPFPY
jgi:hypothetical protein